MTLQRWGRVASFFTQLVFISPVSTSFFAVMYSKLDVSTIVTVGNL